MFRGTLTLFTCLAIAYISSVWSACPTCLEVFSISIYTYLGPTVEAHVKVYPLPSGCTTVMTATWTDPLGHSSTQNAIALGTHCRAEFPFNSGLTGTFVFTVDNITCGTDYTYHGNDSMSITITDATTTTTTTATVTTPTTTSQLPPSVCLTEGESCSGLTAPSCCNGLACKGRKRQKICK